MTTIIRTTLFTRSPAPRSQAMARAGSPGGIGVLGDSYSDEYQFYPPDRTTARNWVEILAATRGLDFGPYAAASRGEPRNQGYAFNWARSDATTDGPDRLGSAHRAGRPGRPRRGRARRHLHRRQRLHQCPEGARSRPGVREVLPRALANHRLAVRTDPRRQPAGQARPWSRSRTSATCRNSPGRSARAASRRPWPTPSPRPSAGTMLRSGRSPRADPRVALIDLDLATRAANLVSTEYALVEGRKLDRLHPGNALDRFFLADVRHPGTLGQGLMARMFVETVNAKFAAGIPPLDSREVLALARSVAHPADPAVKLVSLGAAKGSHSSRAVISARATAREKNQVAAGPMNR